MEKARIGGMKVSRLVIGGNPFSGISHQNLEMDRRMRRYYTTARIKETLRRAEALGVDTVLARTDSHIVRTLQEYWDEGGKMQWIAQTAPELKRVEMSGERAIAAGAKASYIHGGEVDYLLAQGRFDEIGPMLRKIRAAGLVAGLAGHRPEVFRRAEKELEADFYMCSYYDPSPRDNDPGHVPGAPERFDGKDREAMTSLIPKLSRPVIHYKILAAGRNNPQEAFALAARAMRANDAVCVGFYTENQPNIIAEDVALLNKCLTEANSSSPNPTSRMTENPSCPSKRGGT
jgi:hypothetical protein